MNNIVTQTNSNPLAALFTGGVPAYLVPFKEETRISFGTGALNLPALSVRAGKFSLRKGQELSVPLYALFNQAILGMTEGSKASAEIEISYRRGKEKIKKS